MGASILLKAGYDQFQCRSGLPVEVFVYVLKKGGFQSFYNCPTQSLRISCKALRPLAKR